MNEKQATLIIVAAVVAAVAGLLCIALTHLHKWIGHERADWFFDRMDIWVGIFMVISLFSLFFLL